MPNFQELPLNLNDEKIILDGTQELQRVVSKLKPAYADPITPKILDEIYPIVKKGTWWNKWKKNYIVHIFGVGLGNCLVSELGFKWIVIQDNLGREISVKHKDSNLMSFPFSSVRKRIGTKETDFFRAIFEMFRITLENKNVG